MKAAACGLVLLCGVLSPLYGMVVTTEITYEAADLGGGRWEYTYEVTNLALAEGIAEFTIWFDAGQCSNLAVTTPEPLPGGWDQMVLDPDPVLGDGGLFDALALGASIAPGESVGGFSVAFDWLGSGAPGRQFYEIIDPDTFGTLAEGWTVPEPLTLALLGLGGVLTRRRR